MIRAGREIAVAAGMLALTCASACVQLNQPAPAVRDYTLTYPAPHAGSTSLPAVLQIPPFAVSAAYDSHGMMYRQNDLRVGRYPHDRWAANPGNLVADVLARDFAEEGIFRAVQHARAPLTSDYRLAGEVEAIEEIVAADGCSANIELRVLLVNVRGTATDSVLLRRGYSVQERCACDDAPALARALSIALERLSAELRGDVHAAVANHLTTAR